MQNDINNADRTVPITYNVNEYNITVENNEGIVSTGKGSYNEQEIKIIYQKSDDINWEALRKEINILKSSSDPSIKKFADEATEPAESGYLLVIKKEPYLSINVDRVCFCTKLKKL